MLDFSDHSHKRLNILTGEWVLVSPHRSKRPWQGKQEENKKEQRPQYDPNCYLCPGNERAGGHVNPQYEGTFVFDNDFMALRPEVPTDDYNEDDLFVAKGEAGLCRVICFSPRHDLTLADMEVEDIKKVVDLWVEQYLDLGAREQINYVQIFENKGAIMGCSNPHPHGQVWSQSSLPPFVEAKDQRLKAYYQKKGKSMLEDYVAAEIKKDERIVYQNDDFVALVPFWAVWPYECYIVPKRRVPSVDQLTEGERKAYADCMKALTQKYDRLFDTSFPYSAGIHQAPTNGQNSEHWHLHHLFFPPLLRSATVKKFMVGYEMLGMPQRDITAEYAAKVLKEL